VNQDARDKCNSTLSCIITRNTLWLDSFWTRRKRRSVFLVRKISKTEYRFRRENAQTDAQSSPSRSLFSVRYLSLAPLEIVIKTSECERSSRLMQIYSTKDRKREFFGFEGSRLREIKHRLIFSLEGTEAWDFISNLSIPLRNIVQYPAGFSLLVLAMLMKFEWICARKEKVVSLISRSDLSLCSRSIYARYIAKE